MSECAAVNAGKRPTHSRATKYRAIAAILEQEIRRGEHPAGTAIPTLQSLARRFSISEQTAFRAVRAIADKGLVSTAHRRSGAVVLGNNARREVHSALIACLLRPPRPRNPMDNFALDMIEGVRQEISRQGYRFIHHGLDEVDYQKRMLDLARSGQVQGVLLDQKTPASIVADMAAAGVPAVIFNRHLDVPNLSCICPDYEAIARDSVALMLQRGYERVGFYRTLPERPSWTESQAATQSSLEALHDAFVRACRDAGLGPERCIMLTEPACREIAEEPASFGLPPRRPATWRRTGILACTDVNASHILRVSAKAGLRLREDLGIVGCFNMPISHDGATPISTWDVNAISIGTTAVRELLARIENPAQPSSSVRMAVRFVDRGTL